MFASRTHRQTVICAIVFALLAPALTVVAPASANERSQAAALAQERYYSSYGEPEPLTVAQSPAPSDDTPWLPIALSVAAALAIVAAAGRVSVNG